MQVSLSGPRRWLFLLACLALSLPLMAAAARTWLADTWSRADSPQSWVRAAELEPSNAEHWRKLGRYRQWDFENADLQLAAQYFERATALNPESAFLWMDLGSALEMRGETRQARAAYEQARRRYPLSADVAWNYGNFLIRAGAVPEALPEIRRAVEQRPALAAPAVSVCWRAGVEVGRILTEALPAHSRSYMEAVEFFLAQREYGAAVRAWEQLETLSEPLELTRALRIVDTFVEAGRIDEASRAWSHALRASRSPEGYTAGSLVWDGGFEQEFLNAGFGWKNPGAAGVRVDFDSSAPHSGARSLRLRFEGSSNLDLTVPYQIVAVQPATRYRFSAYVKLDGVTTDSGLRFHLFDPRASGAIIAETPNLTGTMPWTQQEVEFVTGPATRLLRISLRRTPSAKFDNKIRGTTWVDEVMLAPAAGGAPR